MNALEKKKVTGAVRWKFGYLEQSTGRHRACHAVPKDPPQDWVLGAALSPHDVETRF